MQVNAQSKKVSFANLTAQYEQVNRELRRRKANHRNNFEKNKEFMGGEPGPQFPFYIPEYPEMPNIISKKKYEERKKLVEEFVDVTLHKHKFCYGQQGDTTFSDEHRENLTVWGKLCYDIIFQNRANRTMHYFMEKNEMNRLQ